MKTATRQDLTIDCPKAGCGRPIGEPCKPVPEAWKASYKPVGRVHGARVRAARKVA